MPDHTRRSKMISLRLSAEEYEALRSLYPTYGARNLSDFARICMQRVITNSLGVDGGILAMVHEIDSRLNKVESQISRYVTAQTEVLTRSGS